MVEPRAKAFAVYVVLKAAVAKLVELLIALDRQCYLMEAGFKSKLYYVYKGEQSHHNIAIYARKPPILPS